MSTKKKYTIPYQYTVIGHAIVYADSLTEAVNLVQSDAPCPDPDDQILGGQILDEAALVGVRFSYLEDSFEIHEEDLNLYGNPK